MFVAGVVASLLIGLALGLIGGGGGILTVPVLVYLFEVPATAATGYSLFVVGVTALAGVQANVARGQVDFRSGLTFAAPAILGVFTARRVLVPAIPERIPLVSGELKRDALLMLIFGALMLIVAVRMLQPGPAEVQEPSPPNVLKLLVVGLMVGLVSGLVGAGGGFLIVPALVLLAGMPMKRAVGTSLLIIALQSLIGFTGEVATGRALNWGLVGIVSAAAIAGMAAGVLLSKRIEGAKLKPGFGWFVLAMGLFVLGREIFALL